MSTVESSELNVGQRVSIIEDGEPTQELGEIAEIKEKTEDQDEENHTILLDLDEPQSLAGNPIPATHEEIHPIGCEKCDQTGVVAERREGTTYPTACPECFSEGKKLGYFWGAEKFNIVHTE